MYPSAFVFNRYFLFSYLFFYFFRSFFSLFHLLIVFFSPFFPFSIPLFISLGDAMFVLFLLAPILLTLSHLYFLFLYLYFFLFYYLFFFLSHFFSYSFYLLFSCPTIFISDQVPRLTILVSDWFFSLWLIINTFLLFPTYFSYCFSFSYTIHFLSPLFLVL